jgi:hypothetical protein
MNLIESDRVRQTTVVAVDDQFIPVESDLLDQQPKKKTNFPSSLHQAGVRGLIARGNASEVVDAGSSMAPVEHLRGGGRSTIASSTFDMGRPQRSIDDHARRSGDYRRHATWSW